MTDSDRTGRVRVYAELELRLIVPFLGLADFYINIFVKIEVKLKKYLTLFGQAVENPRSLVRIFVIRLHNTGILLKIKD